MNAQQYADHIGVSKMRVSQYIKEGRITAVRVGRSYEIDPAIADEQLKGSINQRSKQIKSAPGVKVATESPPPVPPPEQSLIKPPPRTAAVPQNLIKGGPTMAEAQRAREVYRAERERLALLREKEELLPVEAVKKAAFDLGRALRDRMMGIPDRISGQLAVTSDANEVFRVLDEEIRLALRCLANG